MFIKRISNFFTALLVYVDSIILARNFMTTMQCVTQQLNDTFKVKDLGKLKYFLGFEVTQSGNGIHVSQRKYILDVLEDI